MSLFTLVYVSIARREMSEADLLQILEKARTHNAANNITGMLLFRDIFFIQAIEGEEEAIDTLFNRIKQDQRHYNILPIYKKPIERRHFPQWSMGFESPNFDVLKSLPGFSEFMHDPQADNFDHMAMQINDEVENLLQTFRQ